MGNSSITGDGGCQSVNGIDKTKYFKWLNKPIFRVYNKMSLR